MNSVLTCALSLLFAVSCGSAPNATPAADPLAAAGAFTLRSVDGIPVPTSFTSSGYTQQFVADTLTLAADGTWSERPVFHYSYGSTTTDQAPRAGTFTRDGSAVTLSSNGQVVFSGTVNGDALMLTRMPFSYAFQR
jgi:hypothetical protein